MLMLGLSEKEMEDIHLVFHSTEASIWCKWYSIEIEMGATYNRENVPSVWHVLCMGITY